MFVEKKEKEYEGRALDVGIQIPGLIFPKRVSLKTPPISPRFGFFTSV